MTDDALQSEILRRVLAVWPDVVEVRLFGSRAAGTARPDSDADLIVVVPDRDAARRSSATLQLAMRGLPIGCDLVVLTPGQWQRLSRAPGTIGPEALANSRVLHEAA